MQPSSRIALGFTALLRLAWVAAILSILVASLPIPSLGFFHRLLLGFAARGKIMQPSSRKFTVPQRYFLHFYVVAVVLTTCLALSSWFYAYRKMVPFGTASLEYSTVASHLTGGSHMFSIHKSQIISAGHKFRVWRTVFVLLLMEAQVLRRLYETLYVFDYSPSARMHIFGYLTGLFLRVPVYSVRLWMLLGCQGVMFPTIAFSLVNLDRTNVSYSTFFYYIAAPLSLGSSCASEALSYAGGQIAEFIVKGRARMPVPEFKWWELLKPFINLGWCQWIGSAIFFWGWLHQLHCHAILGSLREHRGADEYVIPYGDWFEYVSCPHYLSEIVIYAGILVASGGSDITVWLLFLFVVSNLIFSAAETHRWYRYKFDSYPKSRRAIIPFIY